MSYGIQQRRPPTTIVQTQEPGNRSSVLSILASAIAGLASLLFLPWQGAILVSLGAFLFTQICSCFRGGDTQWTERGMVQAPRSTIDTVTNVLASYPSLTEPNTYYNTRRPVQVVHHYEPLPTQPIHRRSSHVIAGGGHEMFYRGVAPNPTQGFVHTRQTYNQPNYTAAPPSSGERVHVARGHQPPQIGTIPQTRRADRPIVGERRGT